MMVFLVAVRVKDDKKKVLLQSYMKKFASEYQGYLKTQRSN